MDNSDNKDATYYIRVRGRVLGPYGIGQMRTLRGRGQFGRANEVSLDGQTWQSAATIEHLMGTGETSKKARTGNDNSEPSDDASKGSPPSRAMPSAWYYSIGEEQCGPVTLLELRGMISNSQLMPEDLVWKEGLADWVPISGVAELNVASKAKAQSSTPQSVTGVILAQNFCYACGTPIDVRAEVCPKCGVRQRYATVSSPKNRTTAALFALLIGGTGAHHFYLGNILLGCMYLLFCWTFIPLIVSLIEGIVFMCMSDDAFNRRYGNG